MTNNYLDVCTKYCVAHYSLLPETQCKTIEDYLQTSMMARNGFWGTDLELFLAAQMLKTDIFVYVDADHVWKLFSAQGFSGKRNNHDLSEERIYLRLYFNHYQPILKVNTKDKVLGEHYKFES